MDLTSYAERLAPVDAVVRNAIAAGQTPGAVVLVGHQGKVIYRKAFGNRSLEPTVEPMTVDTVFDMASLTKVMATTGSVMRMVQLGQIKLNDPVVAVHSRVCAERQGRSDHPAVADALLGLAA